MTAFQKLEAGKEKAQTCESLLSFLFCMIINIVIYTLAEKKANTHHTYDDIEQNCISMMIEKIERE